MRIFRCPRCRAQDISADAHPTRVLDNGVERRVFVCRDCYRAAELEFRIASEAADVPYKPLTIRESLASLRDFYRERLDEYADPDLLIDEVDRLAVTRPIRKALTSVERRLAIGPT